MFGRSLKISNPGDLRELCMISVLCGVFPPLIRVSALADDSVSLRPMSSIDN